MQSTTSNIFLIGPMGAGKTTAGRQLARKLSKQFFDSDEEIEKRTGVKIPLIFEIEDEDGFRKRECRVIGELTQKKDIVLATGGGAVLDESNRQHLINNGFVVYLKSSPEKLMLRTRSDKTRPLLHSDDPLETIKNILNEREPIYQALADFIINTDNISINRIVNNIYKHYSNL